MEDSEWVAEDPDAHLLPHLERACAELPFDLVGARTSDDGTFLVELQWRGNGRIGGVRQAVFALLGSIAESATYVRQRRDGDTLAFEAATGVLDGRFAPHGHTVRFEIRGFAS